MSEHISSLPVGSVGSRVIGAAAVLVALGFAWFSVSWQAGDLFAGVTSSSSPDSQEIADTAIRLAPSSPRGYWLSGAILKTAFDDQTLWTAIERYESAARVAPNNFRSWTELGRVNEQAGRYDRAEMAFRRATEIAPAYTIPRWQLGNFFLRRGRVGDAVTELNLAAKYNSPYRVQVFSTAWNVLGQDPRQVEQFLTDTGDSKATLAYFYGLINRPDDAIRVWNSINPDDKPQFRWQVEALARDLKAHRSYQGALEFSRQAEIDPDARPEVVTNGDFELPVKSSEGGIRFDWTIKRIDGKVDVAGDASTLHSGRRSLKVILRGYAKPEFNLLQQALAVAPGGRYRLSFWIRTENLRGGSLPVIEVRNGKSDTLIAASEPFGSGSADWHQINVEFSVPTDRDGVYLISNREPCQDDCPMTGVFWLDDFSITRLQ